MVLGKQGHAAKSGTLLPFLIRIDGQFAGENDVLLEGQIGVAHDLIQAHRAAVHEHAGIQLALDKLDAGGFQELLEGQVLPIVIDRRERIAVVVLAVIRGDNNSTGNLLVLLVVLGCALDDLERLCPTLGEVNAALERAVDADALFALVGGDDVQVVGVLRHDFFSFSK